MKVISASDAGGLAGAFGAGWNVPENVVSGVAAILADVRARGDEALLDCVRRNDAELFDRAGLRVPIPDASAARGLVSAETADALRLARDRIARFHERQRVPDLTYGEEDGSRYAMYRRALDAVAVYAPGATGAAPVNLMMSAIPAKLAGVRRVVALTPPRSDGTMHPAMTYACATCGVDELYAVGGAAAVAAAAFGTQTVAPVEKIVGWGDLWVGEAKRQVFGTCGIDGITGPCEVLVVADDGANSEFVAGELLAQAERPVASRLAVVSESRALLEAVAQLLDSLDVKTLERGEAISDAIENGCRLIHVPARDDVFDVIERFAPGYLCLQVRDPSAYLPHIRRAGVVFVGDMTPLACGDYLAGTNSVVPAAGTARFASTLSLSDFTRTICVVENSLERMLTDAIAIAALAELEGLPQHAQTARMRFGG
ncbi:MAG TPA: histidinol dehydrogenase [Candidatus Acidoferrales bacterium]|nr:histidinol dehydrogenase [Candidatus Acidoferrales bacterium]